MSILRSTKWLVLCATFCIMLVSCQQSRDGVLVWPSTAAQQKPGFSYAVDFAAQIDALQRADAKSDAERAFRSGDLRFIADRFDLPRILGVPDDAVVRSSQQRYGFKVVAASADLVTNTDFVKLQGSYQDKFNQTLYNLIAKLSN